MPKIQPLPAYPKGMLGENIKQRSVCLAVAINREGVVYQSHPLYGIRGCPINSVAIQPDFVKAAQDAVMRWRFTPTILCTFPKDVDAAMRSDYCVAEGAEVKPIPIRLAFIFTFTRSSEAIKVNANRLNR